jgi:hypothetical protein
LAEAEAEALLGSDWPGTPSEGFATISDAEEDGWHYVGESGEPAMNADFENRGSDWPALAFRMRQPGIVELVGALYRADTAHAGDELFILPDGYHPTATGIVPVHATGGGAGESTFLSITVGGYVAFYFHPVGYDYYYFSGSFPLDAASTLTP